ncbi:MAG: dihydroorotase [Desulfovibrionaceae bacterium]
MTLCIKNVQYLEALVDVFVEDGRIATMTPSGKHGAPAGAEVVDATGLRLFPSFIDAHVHLREPGFEYKETVASGLNAAVHGGFGAVMCMANTRPVNDNAAVTTFIIEAGKRAFPHGPTVYPIGAATLNLDGVEMAPFAELAHAGCVAISNDGHSMEDAERMRRVMEYAADLGLIVIDHCEDASLARKAHMNEGITSGRIGVKGQPDVGEAMQVARDVLLAEYLNIPIHIAHVSCKRAVDVIAWGKSRGVKITAETCPHYLILDDSALEFYNCDAKVNPPLRTPADREALREAVKSGIIDILVTDHAPHAAHEKECPLDEAPNGITGLDTALSLTYDLVRQGVLTEADLIRLWCTNPARIFAIPCNEFAPGDPADFFLFNPEIHWQVSPETCYSKSCNTPFKGTSLKGRVVAHYQKGVKII